MSAYLANLEQAAAQFAQLTFSGRVDESDYLDLAAVFFELTRHIHAAIFTNFSDHNPYRAWMYYILNWILIERSYNQLMDLCTQAGIAAGSVRIDKEATGLTYLVEVTA